MALAGCSTTIVKRDRFGESEVIDMSTMRNEHEIEHLRRASNPTPDEIDEDIARLERKVRRLRLEREIREEAGEEAFFQ